MASLDAWKSAPSVDSAAGYCGITEGFSSVADWVTSSPASDDTGRSSARGRVRTVTTISIPPEAVPVVPPPSGLRLELRDASRIRGRVDGAWWPRSRDMAQELPPLVEVLDRVWGRITRVTVHEGMWPDLPAKVAVGAHVVRLGWFDSEQESADLCLFSYTVGRWDLLVIPPECDPERAAQLMAAATDVHNPRSPGALLTQ